MQIEAAYNTLKSHLAKIYSNSEAANIANLVIENVTGYRGSERLLHRQKNLAEQQINLIENYTIKLLKKMPVQYVLHEAWFADFKFYVDENVLIPRPETEELIAFIREDKNSFKQVIDIGTGSGCIAISLKKYLPQINVDAIDVSAGALHVAIKNAHDNNVTVNFMQLNFLNYDDHKILKKYDCIVSNPPYIKQSEAAEMNDNVLQYEPHTALFVDDNNALLFYEKIAVFGLTHLIQGGSIFCEINEALGNETKDLFELYKYQTEIKKDMQGKDRIIKAWK